MNSPDVHSREDHLRQLLDQRAARADLPGHGRFPSLSEFSDSPSVYSHPYFSPRPSGTQPEANMGTYEFTLPPRGHSSAPRSPMSDRERLNFPNASSLDLDDDSQCSSIDPFRGDDVSPAASEEELPRISTYGPKMTVHSRAPWELDDDDASDCDEPAALVSGKKRSGNKKDGGKRVWGLGRPNGDKQSEKRPSTDSNRSQGKSKPSMESYSGNGSALLALAQASMSSTSLAMNSPQPTLRDKLSISRLRPRTPSNAHPGVDSFDTRPSPLSSQSSAYASPMSRFVHSASPTPRSPVDPSFEQASSRSPTPSSHGEYTHPYANPDLVRRTYDKPKSIPSPKSPVQPSLPSPTSLVNRSDSNATLTESTASSSMFQMRSNTTMSLLTPVTSLSSVDAGHKDPSSLTPRGRGISNPVLVNKPSFSSLSMMNGVGGSGGQGVVSPRMKENDVRLVNNPGFASFGENPAASSIRLISLEEAQAQARQRSRSATANPVISSNYTVPRSQPTFSDPEPEDQGSRARSASTGGRVRSESGPRPPMPGHTASPGSIPPKTIVRKKSGFMRLFNGKERERGMYSPPPPVPPLASDVMSVSSHSSHHAHRQRKGSTHRVPVPSVSPSLMDGEVSPSTIGSGGSSDSHSGSPPTKDSPRERQLSARRNVPGLSINTFAHTSKLAAPQSAVSERSSSHGHGHTITVTPTASDSFSSVATSILPPSSAPPTSSDFVGLSLRPVSTMFSNSSFVEQLVSPVTMDSDIGTPTTAATAISPLSTEFPLPLKGYHGPNEDDKSAPLISQDSEQSSMAEALQQQILVARRAWQRQIWELEGQVRDLKAEVEELRVSENTAPYCSACGRGNVGRPNTDNTNSCVDDLRRAGVKIGVVNRPRARTGVGSRFASGT
ncbi:hypothetical protein C8Q72DRAFT_400500 [Fomitopsis betulina]|nr:hypothetical protein C8Q72DRAFT_400500 [Fomitopsis betulina]